MEINDWWPHQFVPNGKEVAIGEEKLLDNTKRIVYAQPMHCVHCDAHYMRGKDAPIMGKCPARNTKREMKRINS